MDSETPDIDGLLDKAFGNAPAPATDKVEPEPVAPEVEDKAPEAPADQPEDEPKVDASVIMQRADYTRKMQELARERKALAEEKERLNELAQFRERLESDPDFRDRLVTAWEQAAASGQAAEAAPDRTRELQKRIDRLEAAIANQHRDSYASMVEATATKIAAEHDLTQKDIEAIITQAVNDDLIGFGTKPQQVESRLRMVTASYLLPRAKADGQRELIGQIKDKGKAATPVRDAKPTPAPEPDTSKMGEQTFVKHLVSLAEKGNGAGR